MFKAGDKVRNKYGKLFNNGKYVLTVQRVEKKVVWILETGQWSFEGDLELAEEKVEEVDTGRDEIILYLEKEILIAERRINAFKDTITFLKQSQ